jgi:hypothetical protein
MKLYICIFLAIMACLPQASAVLYDNHYFTVQPGSEKCLEVSLPEDVADMQDGYYTLNVSGSAPVSLKFAKVYAGAGKYTTIPLCFSSGAMEENTAMDYAIQLQSPGGTKVFRGGVCVSERQDEDQPASAGTACDLLNGYTEVFAAAAMKRKIWAEAGQKVELNFYAESFVNRNVTLDLSVAAPGSKESREAVLQPFEIAVMGINFTAPRRPGIYIVNFTARLKHGGVLCLLPECTVKSSADVEVAGEAEGGGWQFSVFPRSKSLETPRKTTLALGIYNEGMPRRFTVQAAFPDGFAEEWETKSFMAGAGEEKEILLNVTPPDMGSYEIIFVAQSGVERREAAAVLSVGEAVDEIRFVLDALNSSALRNGLGSDADRFIADYRENGLDLKRYEELKGVMANAKKESESIRPSFNNTSYAEGEAFNLFYIIIPVAGAVVALIIFTARKMSVVPE